MATYSVTAKNGEKVPLNYQQVGVIQQANRKGTLRKQFETGQAVKAFLMKVSGTFDDNVSSPAN